MTTFSDVLREARNYRGLNYVELAAKMGRTRGNSNYLSHVERGDVFPSYKIVGQFAEALEVEFRYQPGQGWSWRPTSE